MAGLRWSLPVACVACLTCAAPAHASRVCCFRVTVRQAQAAKVDYGNDRTDLYDGIYHVGRKWTLAGILG